MNLVFRNTALILTILFGLCACKSYNDPTPVELRQKVDLGLSVKWAAVNVGATCGKTAKSWYGSYFSWGETSPKSNYAKGAGSKSWQDAATVNWGDEWHMPTDAQIDELINYCKWTWTTNYQGIKNLNGYVVSADNGNSIFLPAAGFRYKMSLEDAGYRGFYWSGTNWRYSNEDVYYLDFEEGRITKYTRSGYAGLLIRPVCKSVD